MQCNLPKCIVAYLCFYFQEVILTKCSFIFIYKKYLYQKNKKTAISITGPNLVFVLTLTLDYF